MAALLALGGAACWGVGDFLGGLASRRMAVIAVLAISQAIGLAGVLLWVLVAREAFPGRRRAAAGRRRRRRGARRPRCAVPRARGRRDGNRRADLGRVPVVGLTADAVQGTFPAALQWLGIALVLAGIATLSREPSLGGRRPRRERRRAGARRGARVRALRRRARRGVGRERGVGGRRRSRRRRCRSPSSRPSSCRRRCGRRAALVRSSSASASATRSRTCSSPSHRRRARSASSPC